VNSNKLRPLEDSMEVSHPHKLEGELEEEEEEEACPQVSKQWLEEVESDYN